MREGQLVEATISRLGVQGDGIALVNGRQFYIPLALPGETVTARIGRPLGDSYTSELVDVLAPSPERVTPPCPHFARCGGCSLQHLSAAPYKTHKRNVVAEALRQHRLTDIEVREPLVMPAATRRRLSMAALYSKDGVILGFNARASHTVINIESCSIARPELMAVLPALRLALTPWLGKARALDLVLTLTPAGIDILITGPEPGLEAREAMAALGGLKTLARISWRQNERSLPEPMLQLTEPFAIFAGTRVPFPAGAFLQASNEGEATLLQLVKGALRECGGKFADLFCGLGTFSLPLLAQGEVLAIESDASAIAALRKISPTPSGLEVEQRDLFREPLTAEELKRFSAVVFDPPRAGAQAQCAELAKSQVPVIVAVSCNPGTFARDAETLVKGGYNCEWVQPVDQFIWSSHIELVARFIRRPAT